MLIIDDRFFFDTYYVSGSSPEPQVKTCPKETNKTTLNESDANKIKIPIKSV